MTTFRPRRRSALVTSALLVLSATACDPALVGEGAEGGEGGEGGNASATVSMNECASGRKWIGGNEGSGLMRPGGDCIGCHDRGEGPRYLLAGTVYETFDQPDDCFGVPDVTVEVTDASGTVFTATTNQAGNFWVREGDGPIQFPFNAQIVYDGVAKAMITAQSTGDCASCHTSTGANLALGRIIVP